jgi:hypothetical protein
MGETVAPWSLVSRTSKDRRPMSGTEMALVEPEVEVVAMEEEALLH